MRHLDLAAQDLLFDSARSPNSWLDEPVSDDQLRAIYEVMRLAPTSFNCQPMRVLFLRTCEARERLKNALTRGNVDKTLGAPVVAVIGYDTQFPEYLPQIFPTKREAKKLFQDKPEFTHTTAFRNGSIQGGYFILAIRAIGLDAAPMSGFFNHAVDAEFFPDGRVKSNFLCAIGRGNPESVLSRDPRFGFDDVITLL